jgi:hypothetical protein
MSKNLIVSNLNVHSNFTPNCNSKNIVEKSITVRTSGVPQTDWLRASSYWIRCITNPSVAKETE